MSALRFLPRATPLAVVLSVLVVGHTGPAAGQGPAITIAAELYGELLAVPWGANCEVWASSDEGRRCVEFRGRGGMRRIAREWCWRGETEGQRGRSYFHILPERSGGESAGCELDGWRATVEANRATRTAIHGYLADRLSRSMAPQESVDPMTERTPEPGSASWRRVLRLPTDTLTVLLYLDGNRLEMIARRAPLVAAVAADSIHWDAFLEEALEYRPRLDARWDRDPAVRAALASRARDTLPSGHIAPPDARREMAALTRLLALADEATGNDRALRLLAADEIAASLVNAADAAITAGEYGGVDSTTARVLLDSLTALGVQAMPSHWGLYYVHELRQRAWREAPSSPWGQRAFAMDLIERRACDDHGAGFQPVLERGRAFLRDHPRSPAAPGTRFAVAVAEETWWSLSLGEADHYVDEERYAEGADAARRRAIALYERLKRDHPATLMARYAARQLPRLRLGIDTNARWYFCIFD